MCIDPIAFCGGMSYCHRWSTSILLDSRLPSLLVTRGFREHAHFAPYFFQISLCLYGDSFFFDVAAPEDGGEVGVCGSGHGGLRRCRFQRRRPRRRSLQRHLQRRSPSRHRRRRRRLAVARRLPLPFRSRSRRSPTMTTARRRGLRVLHRCTKVNLAIGLRWIETRMASPARSSKAPSTPAV